ncbi:uncharacterized protein METZ01_LOCUS499369, partial [marine metagenome]
MLLFLNILSSYRSKKTKNFGKILCIQ